MSTYTFKEISAQKDRAQKLLTDFIKHIVGVACVILPLILAFAHPKEDEILLFHYLLCSLLLCILSGSILLYIVVFQIRSVVRKMINEVEQTLYNSNHQTKGVFSSYNKLLSFFEKTCLLSFLVAISLLVIYAW